MACSSIRSFRFFFLFFFFSFFFAADAFACLPWSLALPWLLRRRRIPTTEDSSDACELGMAAPQTRVFSSWLGEVGADGEVGVVDEAGVSRSISSSSPTTKPPSVGVAEIP